jgi:hypothetical protein
MSFTFVRTETKFLKNCLKARTQISLKTTNTIEKLIAYKQRDILDKYSKDITWALKWPETESVAWEKLENF